MRTQCKNINSLCRWLLTICIVVVPIVSNAQDDRKSAVSIDLNIYNRYDDHFIDTTYMSNKDAFIMLDSLMRDSSIINHTQRINVISSSSIEGRKSYNKVLSQRRMESIATTFRDRYDYIPDSVWNFSYIAENWAYLRKVILNDGNVPNRDSLLSIIDSQTKDVDTKEHLLKTLDGGSSWSYIHKYILPSSRGSVSLLFVPIETMPIASFTPIPVQSVDMPEIKMPQFSQPAPNISRPKIAIRTNLLLDVTSTLNIAIEVPLAPHWSISAEYINPWWKSWQNDFTWQIESLYFDLRYWLGNRGAYNTLTGWSVGVYAGSGMYDLQPFQDKGVQGEYTDFGATLSYAHRLGQSKHWLMEYSVGLGYVTSHYRHYYISDNTTEYGDIKVHNYPWSEETLCALLPTRVGVTLAYLINSTKRNGGKR